MDIIDEIKVEIPTISIKQEDEPHSYNGNELNHMEHNEEDFFLAEEISRSFIFIKEEKMEEMEDESMSNPDVFTEETEPKCFLDYYQPRQVNQGEPKTNLHKNSKTYFKSSYPTRRCPVCGHKSDNSIRLKVHIMVFHDDVKSRQCPHCDYEWVAIGQLKNHMKYHHNGKEAQKEAHKCPYCEYDAMSSSVIIRHIKYHHIPQQCPHCNFRAGKLINLKRHITAWHADEMPYHCPGCDFKAMKFCGLKRHINASHT